MKSIDDISVGDLIHVTTTGLLFLVMDKDDNKENLYCRLVKADTTVPIDYDAVLEMIEEDTWEKVCR
jgi:hypothetical protein